MLGYKRMGRCSKVTDWTVLPERPATLYTSVEAFNAVGKALNCFRRAHEIRPGIRALTSARPQTARLPWTNDAVVDLRCNKCRGTLCYNGYSDGLVVRKSVIFTEDVLRR